jgi:hypothetical protein
VVDVEHLADVVVLEHDLLVRDQENVVNLAEQETAIALKTAVERAGEASLVAVLASAQHRSLVGAGVDDSVQFAGLVARDDHRLAANPRGVVVVVVGNLTLVRQSPCIGEE